MAVGVQAVLGALLQLPDTELYGLEIVKASGLEPSTIYPILQRLRGAGWSRTDGKIPSLPIRKVDLHAATTSSPRRAAPARSITGNAVATAAA